MGETSALKCESLTGAVLYKGTKCKIKDEDSPYNGVETDANGVIVSEDSDYKGLTLKPLMSNNLVKYAQVVGAYFTGNDIRSIAKNVLTHRNSVALDSEAMEEGQIGIRAEQPAQLVQAMQALVNAIDGGKCSSIFEKDSEAKCQKLLESLQTYSQETFKSAAVPKTKVQIADDKKKDAEKKDSLAHGITGWEALKLIGVFGPGAAIGTGIVVGGGTHVLKFMKNLFKGKGPGDGDGDGPGTGSGGPKQVKGGKSVTESDSLNRDALDDDFDFNVAPDWAKEYEKFYNEPFLSGAPMPGCGTVMVCDGNIPEGMKEALAQQAEKLADLKTLYKSIATKAHADTEAFVGAQAGKMSPYEVWNYGQLGVGMGLVVLAGGYVAAPYVASSGALAVDGAVDVTATAVKGLPTLGRALAFSF